MREWISTPGRDVRILGAIPVRIEYAEPLGQGAVITGKGRNGEVGHPLEVRHQALPAIIGLHLTAALQVCFGIGSTSERDA